MSALTKRVVVRISDELEQWIAAQAELEGLDNATWVRSFLTKTMRGIGQHAAVIVPGEPPPEPEVLEPTEPAEPIDVDAMVEQSLAEAEAQGLADPAPEPEQAPRSVRPVFRRPPPFSLANQPGWIK